MQDSYSISGVVLSGGKSRRMGTNKAELCLSGKSLLQVAMETLLGSGVNQVLVSGGTDKNNTPDVIANLGPIGGIMSIYKEFKAKSSNGFLFIPVDMPNLTSSTLKRLIDFGVEHQVPCCYEDCYLPLFMPNNSEMYASLCAAVHNNQLSLNSLIKTNLGRYLRISDPQQFKNLNRIEDWRRFQSEKMEKSANNGVIQ